MERSNATSLLPSVASACTHVTTALDLDHADHLGALLRTALQPRRSEAGGGGVQQRHVRIIKIRVFWRGKSELLNDLLVHLARRVVVVALECEGDADGLWWG